MKKEKIGLDQAADFFKQLVAEGVRPEHIDRVQKNKTLRKQVAEVIINGLENPLWNVYRVTINYDQTVEEMVKAGKYDWKNLDITSDNFHLPRRGTSDVEIHLVHFGKIMNVKDVLRELDKMGLRPAELPELLSLGATHPDLQRQFPIIALGSVFCSPHGSRGVPELWGSSGGRELDLNWLELAWDGDDRFAAVRK